jgi:hypothetical protein
LVIKNIITEGYTDEMKRINLFFYYQRIYRRKKNYRQKIHRRSISVGKLITDGICVLHRRKNFIGKTVKSCSELINFFSREKKEKKKNKEKEKENHAHRSAP